MKIEDAGSGKSVDVSFYLPSQPTDKGTAVAYEVHLTGDGEDAVAQVTKDLDSGFDEVVLCVDHWEGMEKIKERLSKELKEDGIGKVRFQLLAQFLD